MKKIDLTSGNVFQKLMLFSIPFFLSSFMQTFYGMADLFIVGLYNDSSTVSAVSIGSQIMHMLTVILIGLVMGATILIGKAVGEKDTAATGKTIGTSLIFFVGFSIILTVIMVFFTSGLTNLLMTPAEAVEETKSYLLICFLGIVFINAYNMICCIFRGLGDSKSPMYFIGIACILNIALDFLLVGKMGLGAAGAALGTVISQAVSSVIALWALLKRKFDFTISREMFKLNKMIIKNMLKIGIPIAMQDGFIQVSFVVITVIANSRGLVASAGVGIVEKIIGFMFLVPSSMLASISTITAQNEGAGRQERSRKTMWYGIGVCVAFGAICFLSSHFCAEKLVGLFSNDIDVMGAGGQYLRSYSIDCILAGIHFCFSGYFCGQGKSFISFVHNLLSILLLRIPLSYIASVIFPDTLYPMGVAAPIGSLFSIIVCVVVYYYIRKRKTN